MFFLIKLCCLDTLDPCLLLAREVAREMETDSPFSMLSSLWETSSKEENKRKETRMGCG